MKCRKGKERLIEYVYNELSAAEKKQFQIHLKECEECRQGLEELRHTRSKLKEWKPVSVKKSDLDSMMMNFAFPRSDRSKWLAIPLWAKIAATAGLFLVVLSLINLNLSVNADGFKVSFSVIPKSNSMLTEEHVQQLLTQSRTLTLKDVENVLERREAAQVTTVSNILNDYVVRSELSRKYELQGVLAELEKLKLQTSEGLIRTGMTLENVVDYLSSGGNGRKNSKMPGKI